MRLYSKNRPHFKSMRMMELIQDLQGIYMKIGRIYTYNQSYSYWDDEIERELNKLVEEAWKLENELEEITDLEYEDNE